jgi:hypothetical protein
MEDLWRGAMRAFIIFSGTGPILILTTYPSLDDDKLLERLHHKGIAKFIAYEVAVDRVREVYGLPFEVIAGELKDEADLRVLDFNGHHIFSSFSLAELGGAVKVGD